MNTVTAMNTAVKTASVSLVVDNTKPLTMSTLQIAQMMDRVDRHRDIKRTVDRLVSSGVIVHTPTAREQLEDKFGRSREIEVYLLDERSSYIVVAQISPEFTAFIVDEWKRLKEENEKLRSTPVNPYADFEETDWIELALKKTRENKKLIELHVRKSVDSHSMTRLLGAKKGATKVKEALTALRTAGYIERVYDENNKPCGYVANDSSLSFCRMNAHYQLEFTVDVLPVLVELGVLEEEQKATLNLPKPNNTILIQNKAAKQIRESGNVISLVDFGI